MRAELIRDGAGLAAIEPAWWALFARTAATPFVAPAWLLPWWRVFAHGCLHTVAVWQGDALVGLAPLTLEDGPYGRRLLPLGIGLSDYADVLVDPACATEAWAALFAALHDAASAWTLWSAEEAAPGAAVLAAALPAGWDRMVEPQSACPVLSLAAADGRLQSVVPSGMMRKWRMAQHRLDRRRSCIADADRDDVDVHLADLVRLHAARWESRGEAGVLADPRVQAFHAAAAPALLDAGLLDLFTLRIEEAVAGVYYGLRRGTRRFAYLQGFDPGFAYESPGTLLVGRAVAQAHAVGAEDFHFLRGREEYKYRWGAVDRWNSRCTFRRLP